MVNVLTRMGNRWFPERQILIRTKGRVSHISLSSGLQGVLAVGVVAAAVWGGYTVVVDPAAVKRAAELEMVVSTLEGQLAQARQAAADADTKLAAVSADDQAGMDMARHEAERLDGRVRELERALQIAARQSSESRSLYEQTAALLEHERGEQHKLLAEKGKLQQRVGELEQEKDQTQRALVAEREHLRQQVAELERKYNASASANLASAGQANGTLVNDVELVASAAPAGVGPLPTKADLSGGPFNLDRFLGQFGLTSAHVAAVGGPYVAMGDAKPVSPAEEARAREVLKALPLTAPLDTYRLESNFGARTDPFNGHQSVHTGVDLSAPYRTPVMSTAGGTVVFAGYAAAYGKMVEVDHGNGIHTRYAHLNRITVNVGQRIAKRTEVGLLGSTGRSTGPHVHYEVLVNGIAQDPERFLQAGKSIALASAPR